MYFSPKLVIFALLCALNLGNLAFGAQAYNNAAAKAAHDAAESDEADSKELAAIKALAGDESEDDQSCQAGPSKQSLQEAVRSAVLHVQLKNSRANAGQVAKEVYGNAVVQQPARPALESPDTPCTTPQESLARLQATTARGINALAKIGPNPSGVVTDYARDPESLWRCKVPLRITELPLLPHDAHGYMDDLGWSPDGSCLGWCDSHKRTLYNTTTGQLKLFHNPTRAGEEAAWLNKLGKDFNEFDEIRACQDLQDTWRDNGGCGTAMNKQHIAIAADISKCSAPTFGGYKTIVIRIFDRATKKLVRTLQDPDQEENICRVCFSPDGKYLASVAWARARDIKLHIRVWDLNTGICLRRREVKNHAVSIGIGLCWLHNSALIIDTDFNDGETLYRWDLDSNEFTLFSGSRGGIIKKFILSKLGDTSCIGIHNLLPSPDGTCLLVRSCNYAMSGGLNRLRLLWPDSTDYCTAAEKTWAADKHSKSGN